MNNEEMGMCLATAVRECESKIYHFLPFRACSGSCRKQNSQQNPTKVESA